MRYEEDPFQNKLKPQQTNMLVSLDFIIAPLMQKATAACMKND